jgi:hypothetical protein
MKRRLVCTFVAATAAATLFACGPDSLPTPVPSSVATGFIGTWSGSTVVNGQTSVASLRIGSAGGDQLIIADICGDHTGPIATVSDEANFTVGPLNCPPGLSDTCNATTFAVASGTGSLSNGQLTISFVGALVGCGASTPFNPTFTGHRQ